MQMLDFSKFLSYDFRYIDIGSLFCVLETSDVYEDFCVDKKHVLL